MIASINTAGYLASCIQSRDYIAFCINHLCVKVALYTAHRVMNRRNTSCRIERSIVNAVVLLSIIGKQGTSKLVLLTF